MYAYGPSGSFNYYTNNGGTYLGYLGSGGLTLQGTEKVVSPGGVQPNGSSGGYSAEVFPLGVKSVHPQFMSGTCASVATTGTVCTFPNSFAFTDATYTCRITAEGSTPAYFSYDTKTTTSFKAYSNSGTPTIDYSCLR
jgi:hypothetical protein